MSVIAALAYLKDQGSFHGDIKPSSILINYEGKVKLLPKPEFMQNINSYNDLISGQIGPVGCYLSPKLVENF